jgi:hypothetical protein
MIYRGPGFLAVVWMWLLSPTLPPLPSKGSTTATHKKAEKERQLTEGRRGGGRGGAKSYHSEKAWSNSCSMYIVQSTSLTYSVHKMVKNTVQH